MTHRAPAPALELERAPCPTCGARSEAEANGICQPRSDETGEVFCDASETDSEGYFLFPTQAYLVALDAWIDAEVERLEAEEPMP